MRPAATPRVVLVVEDDALLRLAIAHELSHAGFKVLEASTGEQAIAHAHAGRRVDVVFTDIQLADKRNGLDVADQFRAARADVAIIYTSGNSVDRSRRVADSLFFDKPYDAAAVVQACRRNGAVEGKMQRYFLHVQDGNERIADPEGGDFADLGSARAEAIQVARELISQCVLAGTPIALHRVFEIVDDHGRTVATVPFSAAVDAG